MKHRDHICENYETCWDREMALPEDERCPHIRPHGHFLMCDISCSKDNMEPIEVHCRKIILKQS